MRNSLCHRGVYSHMLRVQLFLICAINLLAQQWFNPASQHPMDAALQAVWQAGYDGRPGDIGAARERARALLQRQDVNSPEFAGWARQVAQLYQNARMNAQALIVLKDTLARTAARGESHPAHISTLDSLASFYQQNGNLLAAVNCMEQLIAAQATAPPGTATQPADRRIAVFVRRGDFFSSGDTVASSYVRLVGLYQQLGRPGAAEALAAKIRSRLAGEPIALARFYEQQEQLDEAEALYKKVAEQPGDPQSQANAWQALANLEAQQQRYGDAVAAMRQAIAAVQSSANDGVRSQAVWMRQNMATYMRQAGMIEQADEVFQQLIRQHSNEGQQSQFLGAYAQHLGETGRGAQAESVLKSYLAENPNLEPGQKMNALFNLSNVVQRAGDAKRSEEYAKAAQALQPVAQEQPSHARQALVAGKLQKAQAAMNEHHLDDAYNLALEAIDGAAFAEDGQQVGWMVPQIASVLADEKQPAKGERLYQRLFDLSESWSAESLGPLLTVAQNYVSFLMSQPEREGEVPAAIERLRTLLADANGHESSSMAQPLHLTIRLATGHKQWEQAEEAAHDLLKLEEALSGNTSRPYLDALQTAARASDDVERPAGALPLRRQAMAIADLLGTQDRDWLRSATRMDVAMTLARLGQFDEAETLGAEAVSLTAKVHQFGEPLTQQLTQILQMKRAAAVAVAASREGK